MKFSLCLFVGCTIGVFLALLGLSDGRMKVQDDSNNIGEETSLGSLIIESSKYDLLSLVPRSRAVREIGGLGGNSMDHIEVKIKDACLNSDKLDQAIKSMKTCTKAKEMFATPKEEYVKHIDNCSKEVRKLLKQCLPEKLRYLPDFLFELFESVIALLYDDFGEILRGLSPCLSKLKREESEDDYHRCIERVGDTIGLNIPESKKLFCDKFIPISSCFIKQLNDTCTSNKDLEKFKVDYMIAMERPCK